MATPELAIAKAALLASLLRASASTAPGPSTATSTSIPACARADVDAFHTLLEAAIARCTAPNIQV